MSVPRNVLDIHVKVSGTNTAKDVTVAEWTEYGKYITDSIKELKGKIGSLETSSSTSAATVTKLQEDLGKLQEKFNEMVRQYIAIYENVKP